MSDDSGTVMGYITVFSADQYGAIASNMSGDTPTLVTTIEEAVHAILE
ncbi:hypothetical protein ACFDTO_03530 [Microbacteriaceae bacterium 4G12]